jgi:hypothetical protein
MQISGQNRENRENRDDAINEAESLNEESSVVDDFTFQKEVVRLVQPSINKLKLQNLARQLNLNSLMQEDQPEMAKKQLNFLCLSQF